jgi:hypothetical protein
VNVKEAAMRGGRPNITERTLCRLFAFVIGPFHNDAGAGLGACRGWQLATIFGVHPE